jgi:two-component system sensor histidine kinase AlgZ
MTPNARSSTLSTCLQTARIVVMNAAFWLALCVVGAAGSYSDALRSHRDVTFAHLLANWCWDHVPVCTLGIALHLANRRWPDCFASAARVVAGYALVLLLFLPCELLFIGGHELFAAGRTLSPRSLRMQVLEMHRFDWFTEFAWTSGTYVAVVALCVWRLHRTRERAWLRAERDNLTLRLELEQQRLQSLRGQLEPHFMFNALNAISALVRRDDRTLALAGIARLSDLLRYALAASECEWVALADELQFVRDYLSLQRLRYGDKLRVTITGATADVLGTDCPPLLLQPLVENALRHGLDRDAGAGEIVIAFALAGPVLIVRMTNRLVDDAPANPGTGVGLKNVAARLRTAYGDRARFEAGPAGDAFVAEVRLPLDGADAEADAGIGMDEAQAAA